MKDILLIPKLKNKAIQHISFDLWLTLIRSNPDFKTKRNRLFKDFFEINDSIEKVTEIVRYYDVLCNSINEKTELNLDTFEIYYLILKALNVNIELISTDKLHLFYSETESLFMQNKPTLIFPKTVNQLAEITADEKTVSILSNTGFIKGKTLRKLLYHYELEPFLSFQIYSDEEKISKPNFLLFDKVFNEINKIKLVEKKAILHIGDNELADYKGALSYGFDAVLIKN